MTYKIKVRIVAPVGNNAFRIEKVPISPAEIKPDGILIDDSLMVTTISLDLVPVDLRIPNSEFFVIMKNPYEIIAVEQ